MSGAATPTSRNGGRSPSGMAPDAKSLLNGYRREIEDERSYSPVSQRDQFNLALCCLTAC